MAPMRWWISTRIPARKRVPSAAGVIHAMTIWPRVSASSLNCFTAHWRQAHEPREVTERLAGVGQLEPRPTAVAFGQRVVHEAFVLAARRDRIIDKT